MSKMNLSGNEAVARAAVDAGAKLITGYPGTPSSEVIGSIWDKAPEGVAVEWSVNEKVAFEQAGACAWAGQRALSTMKMSGLNVAYDSVISIAYSGCVGGLVLYVCDDPGVAAGMPEQDVRGFALMSDLPVLEPASVLESYTLTRYAFELSEAIGGPVMVRSVTNVAQSHALVELPPAEGFTPREPALIRDIMKYTKAGAKICMDQHQDLLGRLEQAETKISADRLYTLDLSEHAKVGVVSVGVANSFLTEARALLQEQGIDTDNLALLKLSATSPLPRAAVAELLTQCETVAVLEENEPYVEKALIVAAYQRKKQVRIIGKLEGPLSRIGSYNALTCAKGMAAALGAMFRTDLFSHDPAAAEALCCARPIGVCAGCPHRGVYIGLNQAVKKLGYKKDQVMITGDIGCTILGMSPPFHTLWTEVAMGASIAMAQGYVHAGVKTPVFATIGDSTFMHAGMPPLLNAVQNQTPVTVIIMDNGWTAMTGMQVNANTAPEYQQTPDKQRVDVVDIVKGLGVRQLFITDPYDLPKMTETIVEAARLPGVKVIVTRRECAIQAGRHKKERLHKVIDEEKCINCKLCITTTGCPSLVWDGVQMKIDPAQCNGCGVCVSICPKEAIGNE